MVRRKKKTNKKRGKQRSVYQWENKNKVKYENNKKKKRFKKK